jgi:hypothetical protein
MTRGTVAFLAIFCVGVVAGIPPVGDESAAAGTAPKLGISEDARLALAQMASALRAKEFSFLAKTIRVYSNEDGVSLHIAHEFNVTVRRPDRLLVDGTGDDGPRKLIYDGNTVVLAMDGGKSYATLPVPNTIEHMMQVVMGRFGLDFPLSDFLTNAPDKAFLTGVASGHQVNTVMIDGVPCRHLVFLQPPGIELEVWLQRNDPAVPRRLIIVYNSLPGKPTFVAEMSGWNFNVHPSDAEFSFKPPEGAAQIQFGAAAGGLQMGAQK